MKEIVLNKSSDYNYGGGFIKTLCTNFLRIEMLGDYLKNEPIVGTNKHVSEFWALARAVYNSNPFFVDRLERKVYQSKSETKNNFYSDFFVLERARPKLNNYLKNNISEGFREFIYGREGLNKLLQRYHQKNVNPIDVNEGIIKFGRIVLQNYLTLFITDSTPR